MARTRASVRELGRHGRQRDSLLREVDEELRRERYLKLWEQYGTYIIAATVLIIGGIGGYKYYEHRSALAAEAAGARMAVATRDAAQNRSAEAQKALDDIAATGPSNYALLARLRSRGHRLPARRPSGRRLRCHRHGFRRHPLLPTIPAAGRHSELGPCHLYG